MLLRVALLLSLLATGPGTPAWSPGPDLLGPGTIWRVDRSRSEVRFRIRHLVTRVTGRFTEWDARIVGGTAWEKASVEAVIRTNSIDTGDDRRDAHLRSPDFFSADSFPTMRYQGTRVRVSPQGELELTGKLTIRERTRPVTLRGRLWAVPGDSTRVAFQVTTTLNRLDYGIAWNRVVEGGGLMLGDEVAIEIEGEAIRVDSAAGS